MHHKRAFFSSDWNIFHSHLLNEIIEFLPFTSTILTPNAHPLTRYPYTIKISKNTRTISIIIFLFLPQFLPTIHEFSTFIYTRDSPLQFDKLFDKLVDFEIYIHHDELNIVSAPIIANFAHRGTNHFDHNQ